MCICSWVSLPMVLARDHGVAIISPNSMSAGTISRPSVHGAERDASTEGRETALCGSSSARRLTVFLLRAPFGRPVRHGLNLHSVFNRLHSEQRGAPVHLTLVSWQISQAARSLRGRVWLSEELLWSFMTVSVCVEGVASAEAFLNSKLTIKALVWRKRDRNQRLIFRTPTR